jgi:hypothetical protein
VFGYFYFVKGYEEFIKIDTIYYHIVVRLEDLNWHIKGTICLQNCENKQKKLKLTLFFRHGKVPWEDLFTAAIRVAEDGFLVTDLLYSKLVVRRMKDKIINASFKLIIVKCFFFFLFFQKSQVWIEKSTEFSKVYAPSGVISNPGDLIRRPSLGATLRTIASDGANVFYEVCWIYMKIEI